MTPITFNKPYLTGKEMLNIYEAVLNGKISGDGVFTERCHEFFNERYGFRRCLLTTSCTDALEMAAILLDIQPGDEVIVPSYTFVSTANAFVLRGANIIFCDSHAAYPGINEDMIEQLITPRTKAIVPVHYGGMACDMDKIVRLADKYNLFIVEDAAQAIDSYYTGSDGSARPLGTIGHLAAFSFHETKNIMSGEGGMLVINDARFDERAEIIREKGTDRSKFFRGEVDKYRWVDIGSSYLPSDIIAAFLFAQLENLDDIQQKRKEIWNAYNDALKQFEGSGLFTLPHLPPHASNNAHMFYLVAKNMHTRDHIIKVLREHNIQAVFHYQSLHKSPFYTTKYNGGELPNADRYSDCLLRLPMYYELQPQQVIEAFNQLK